MARPIALFLTAPYLLDLSTILETGPSRLRCRTNDAKRTRGGRSGPALRTLTRPGLFRPLRFPSRGDRVYCEAIGPAVQKISRRNVAPHGRHPAPGPFPRFGGLVYDAWSHDRPPRHRIEEQTDARQAHSTLVSNARSGTCYVRLDSGHARAHAHPPSREAAERPFPVSLNTSTLRGHKLPITRTIDIAAKAGYRGIEPWPNEIDDHLRAGGTLEDLRKRLEDHNLKVTGAIAFFRWMVDDDKERRKALDEARALMDKLAALGASHVAAPPSGNVANVDLLRAAERYHELLKIGDLTGVTPAVEVWGFAKKGHRLGQAVLIALEAHHPKACILPDVYHLYKGGSGLAGIRSLNGGLIGGFHINDYPADPPRERIRDEHRIYPGDGIAPLEQLFRDLRAIGYTGPVSIELFNREYYKQDPLLVARTAFEKTEAVIRKALAT